MGGAVSAGKDNEELVDNLCTEGYINDPSVERVFRQVDRSEYMIFEEGDDPLEAYEDHAWRKGKLHLSAPCIYSRAMEALQLEEGVSFLNVGSGTGYLSTMAGLIIGPRGVNHGIELHEENVEYARTKLSEFLKSSPWYDPVEFCDPVFVVGNGLLVSPGNMLYDRIYCGAGCPPEHAQLMKNMISVGGLLVMPLDTELQCVRRTGQTDWETEVILPSVSFASLMLPSKKSVKETEALELFVEPSSLRELSRLVILQHLGRTNYDRISELPLPPHLKDYLSYHRDWGSPPAPLKALCPIDHSVIAEGSPEGAEGNGAASADSSPFRNEPSFVQAIDSNGRNIILCNFNGITLQLPMDPSDYSDTPSENEEDNNHEVDTDDNNMDTHDNNDSLT